MSNWETAPDNIVLDFLTAAGTPINLFDLDSSFINALGLSPVLGGSKPFRIAIQKKQSKAGNAYYEYWQNGVPLPDGLMTFLRVEGVVIPMGKTHPSKSNNYPTREGSATISVGNDSYEVTAYLTEGKQPYYVRIIAHKKSSATNRATQVKPRGGTIL